jgi:DNA-damage-inducible protein D
MTKKVDTPEAASTDALAAGKTHLIDFESIKHVNPYGMEYWSARELAPLLGYTKWERFEGAIKRAMTACAQVGGIVGDHFPATERTVRLGSGAERALKDYALSRLACYLIAENGDPRKREIAQAQVYFVVSTRQNELRHLGEQRDERIRLRERVSENNKKLAEAAHGAGVLSRSFGVFQNAGYRGLYGGLDLGAIKARKGIGAREDLLDRSGRAELAANDFRITQTEERLRKEGIIGQTKAMDTHHEVGQTVRRAIEEIGGTMPEDLPPEHSIKPVIEARRRRRKKIDIPQEAVSETEPHQGSLFD